MKTNKDIWTLSANYLSGEMLESERKDFDKMLRKNKNVREEFEKVKISWDHLTDEKPVETNLAWEKLYNRLDEDDLLETGKSRNLTFSNPLYKVAAIFIFVAISAFAAYFILPESIRAPKGYYSFQASETASSFTFSEGSSVFLNKDAVVYYAEDFNNNRKVKLKGEGFFKVMSDPGNAFQIETERGFISVLGTKFNVKENKEKKTTEVFVESGKVKLSASTNAKGIILEKGEFGSSNGNSELKIENKDMNFLAWRTHEFEFSDENLGTILEVLQESYHIEIKLYDNEIKNFKLTSTYSQQSIDAIINTICVAFNLDYKLEKGKYILSMK